MVSIDGNTEYRDWMQQALLSSRPIPKRSFALNLLSAQFPAPARIFTSVLPSSCTGKDIVDQTSTQDTSPLLLMLSELHGQTTAFTGLTFNDVVVSYPTFMTPRQQLAISDAAKLANLTDIGCHPSSDSAIAAAVASQFDCPLPPPDVEDGTTYARQRGAFRILSFDINDFALTARFWHSWDAGTAHREAWFAQPIPGHSSARGGMTDYALFWADVATHLLRLIRMSEPYSGIWVQYDGYYVDAKVELVVLTGSSDASKQLLSTVLQVLSNTTSRPSSPELRSHLQSLLDYENYHRLEKGGCTVDPVFAAARGAALYQHMKTSNMCYMPCELLEAEYQSACLGLDIGDTR